MVIQSSKAPVSQVLARSIREEGITFLFKGWTPAFIRLGPNTVLLFVFFEVWRFLSCCPLTHTRFISNSKMHGGKRREGSVHWPVDLAYLVRASLNII